MQAAAMCLRARFFKRLSRDSSINTATRQKYLETRGASMKSKVEVAIIKPNYLRSAAAAKYLGVSVRTLTNWVQARMVAQIKPSERVSLFRIADLDAALNRFRSSAIAEM